MHLNLYQIEIRLITLLMVPCLLLASPAEAKAKKRRPANVSKTGAPILPDGSPDYSRYPNPFVVKRWTFDVGGASGQAGDLTYSEFGLAANAYFYNWLAWRNLAFTHGGAKGEKYFGLDMSERMSYEFSRKLGFAVFASPGYRFAGGGQGAPFAEAGFQLDIGSLKASAGAREMLGSWVRTGRDNEMQIFVSIGTGGGR